MNDNCLFLVHIGQVNCEINVIFCISLKKRDTRKLIILSAK